MSAEVTIGNCYSTCLQNVKEVEATSATDCDVDKSTCHLSKRQLKRLKKRQHFEEHKQERRKAENAKRKEKRALKRAAGLEVGPSRKELKRLKMADSACKIRVAVDMAFDELMMERDQRMAVKLQHCYSTNRRAPSPLQLYITSFAGSSREFFNSCNGSQNWDANIHTEDLLTLFNAQDIVYLTCDSDNVLTSLEADKMYVIGGLVDHNSHKGVCHKLALEKGFHHARLPIAEHLTLKARHVLTINHVFEILLKFSETADWLVAFNTVIPKRKFLQNVVKPDEAATTT